MLTRGLLQGEYPVLMAAGEGGVVLSSTLVYETEQGGYQAQADLAYHGNQQPYHSNQQQTADVFEINEVEEAIHEVEMQHRIPYT